MDETVRKISAEDINPRYNWGRALPALGTMGVDFEERVDYRRLHRYRLSRLKQALNASDLGALLVMDVNNIRYMTSTKIGEWERDKICRWALLTRDAEDPILWDFGSAAVHHRLYLPVAAAGELQGRPARPARHRAPSFGLMDKHAKEIASLHQGGRLREHAGRRRPDRAGDDVRTAEGRPEGRRRPAGDAGGARDQIRRRDRAA